MNDRLMMKGALEEKKQDRLRLATRAEALIRGLRTAIMPASVMPLDDLRTAEVAEMARELNEVKQQYSRLMREIDDIKRELGL